MKIKNIFLIITILLFANFNAFSQSIDDEFTIGEEGNSLYYYVTSVNPNEVAIYNDSFEGEELIIPNIVTYEGIEYNVTSIGGSAFEENTYIISLVIPENIKQIYPNAFYSCVNLETVTIKSTKISIIPSGCFDGCTKLHSISLPNTITEIGASAFNNNKSLTEISLPNTITKIGASAFNNNTSLTEISLPNTITEIGENAFFKCKNIVTIRCNSITPPTLGSTAFGATSGPSSNKINANLKIYVPATSTEDYKKAASWSNYYNRIVGVPTFITDGNWTDPNNWSPEGVPASDESV